jgi:hypothetical protein
MKKASAVLAVVTVGSMFVAGTVAALTPVDPTTIKVLVPKAGGAPPAATKSLATVSSSPLVGSAKTAALTRIRGVLGGSNIPRLTAPSPFSVGLGALTSVPSGVTVNILGITALQPQGSGYEGLFLGSSDHSPIGTGIVIMAGIPAGTWLVQCAVSASADFSVGIATRDGGSTESISASSSGLAFAAVVPSGTGTVQITNVQDWIWQSCSFEPAQ